MALHARNSAAESGRELFKGLKESSSRHLKKNFWLGGGDFLCVTS